MIQWYRILCCPKCVEEVKRDFPNKIIGAGPGVVLLSFGENFPVPSTHLIWSAIESFVLRHGKKVFQNGYGYREVVQRRKGVWIHYP